LIFVEWFRRYWHLNKKNHQIQDGGCSHVRTQNYISEGVAQIYSQKISKAQLPVPALGSGLIALEPRLRLRIHFGSYLITFD
jgi:hypothetical protein